MTVQLCKATKKNGQPCTQKPKKGHDLCAAHLGVAHAPTKLTPDVQQAIVSSIEIGNSLTGACRYAGITRPTLASWIERGEADSQNGNDTPFAAFFDAVTRAKGMAEHSLVAEIRRAATGWVNPSTRRREGADWRAAAWLLERRPESRAEWGRELAVHHSGGVRTDAPSVPEDEGRLLAVGGILAAIGAIGDEVEVDGEVA